MDKPLRSQAMLDSFVDYCVTHPEHRFWQALRNWAREHIDEKINFIIAAPMDWFDDRTKGEDTWNWENNKLK